MIFNNYDRVVFAGDSVTEMGRAFSFGVEKTTFDDGNCPKSNTNLSDYSFDFGGNWG